MERLAVHALAAVALIAAGVVTAHAGSKVAGDPAKAEPLVTSLCASCHGQDGNSPVAQFPKLAGQHAEYLLREMREYQDGRRQSEIMRPLIAPLSEDDLANLAVYFAAQKPAPGIVSQPALLAAGKRLYLEGNSKAGVPSCDGCHEEDGSGTGRFPRVAGQHAEYALEQIQQYAHGQRTNGIKVMRTIAQRLTPEEAKAVSEYMASMP